MLLIRELNKGFVPRIRGPALMEIGVGSWF